MLTLKRRFRVLLMILGWSTTISGIILAAVFQGYLVPTLHGPYAIGGQPIIVVIYYLGILAVSILAAVLIDDPGLSILGFFLAFPSAWVIAFIILSLPATLGVIPVGEILVTTAITVTFAAFFPFVLIAGLVGTFVGIVLSERVNWQPPQDRLN